MKKIIHLLSSSLLSGAERVAINIISCLKDRFLFAYCCPEGPIVEILKENDIEWIKMDGEISPLSVRKALWQRQFDAIHAHDYRASVFSTLAFPSTIVISHLHSNCPWSEKFDLRSILYWFFHRRYRKIIVVSNDIIERSPILRFLSKRPPMQFVEIMNGIDVNNVRQIASVENAFNKWDLVFCGRLTEAKFPERFVETVIEVRKSFPELRAVMLGDGELAESVWQKIKANGMENQIRMLGFVANPFCYIKNSKIMVMTSRWEGFPMAAIEAMALNVPVVSTPVSGMRGLEKNAGGVLIAESVKELANKIIVLLQNEVLRAQVGKMAGGWVQANLDSVKFAEKMYRVYEEIL